MKRTKGDASMGNRDVSYTNLAAMVSNIENQQLRTVGAGGGSSSSEVVSMERQLALRTQGLELIRKATQVEKQLDWVAANQYYFQASSLYQQALDGAMPGPLTDEMQRDLEQLHSHMQNISSDAGLISRSSSEGAMTSAMPPTPKFMVPTPSDNKDASFSKHPTSVETFRNFFDCGEPNSLPYELRDAVLMTAEIFEQLVRQFGFQYSSMRNQQEHLAMLLANSTSHEDGGDVRDIGLTALHRQLMSNYIKWAQQLGITPQCAGDSDVSHNKVSAPSCSRPPSCATHLSRSPILQLPAPSLLADRPPSPSLPPLRKGHRPGALCAHLGRGSKPQACPRVPLLPLS